MYSLRYAATRMILRPAKQVTTIRPVQRLPSLQLRSPAFARQFHQTWNALAEEDKKETSAEKAAESPAEAEASSSAAAAEVSPAEEAREVREESIATPEVADAASSTQRMAQSAKQSFQAAGDRFANVARNGFSGRDRDRSTAEPTKILYAGNLFFEVSVADLQAEFEQYGNILSTRIAEDNRGLSKGFGFVEFESLEDAKVAKQRLDQQELHGRRMSVQYHTPRANRGQSSPPALTNARPSKTLFIGNMSYQMSDRDLNELFQNIRNVLDVRVAIDRRTGQPRGFAHADFIDIESAQAAKQVLGDKVIYGRALRIDFSREAKSPSSGDSDGPRDP